MKGKRQQDCPICRKKITSDPVYSLALDNAISKIVEKLEPEERRQREEVKESHRKALLGLTSAPASRAARTGLTRVTSTATTRVSAPVPLYSLHTPVVLSPTVPPSSTVTPIVISDTEDASPSFDTDGDVSSSDESVDSDFDDYPSDSDSYEEGLPGAMYGGFGYCFTCGELQACYMDWTC